MTLMTDKDIRDFVDAIELVDGTKMLTTGSRNPVPFFSKIFVEAPLGQKYGTVDIFCANDGMCLLCEVKTQGYRSIKNRLNPQIERYAKAIADQQTDFRSGLVQEVKGLLRGRKVYLISVTDDDKPPSDLIERLNQASLLGSCSVGWAPYRFFKEVLGRHGFEIKGRAPHMWAEHSSGA